MIHETDDEHTARELMESRVRVMNDAIKERLHPDFDYMLIVHDRGGSRRVGCFSNRSTDWVGWMLREYARLLSNDATLFKGGKS